MMPPGIAHDAARRGGPTIPSPMMPSPAGDGLDSSIFSHLAAIFENTSDAIWSVDRERRFVTFNSFMYENIRTAWGVEIRQGMHHGGMHGEEAEFWDDAYTRAFQGEHVAAEREYHNKSGDAIVEFSLNPIRDRSGSIIGVAGIGRNVTHLHQLDAEIRKREAEFRQILDSTGDVIWSVDAEYRFTVFNSFLRNIILASIGKEITVGMSYLEVQFGEEAEFWKGAYDRAFQGEQFMIEREYKNPAGHAIIEFSFSPIWQNGSIVGVVGIGRNVMRLHEIQWALERSEQSYRQLFEDSPLPMWTADFETLRFIQFNRAAMKLYGYSEEEFRNLTLEDIRPLEDREAFVNRIEDILNDQGDRHYQSKRLRKNGRVLDVEIFSHRLEIDGHQARLTLVKDITKRLRAEASLVHANERFRLASEAITSVIWDWDVRTKRVECFGPLDRVLGLDAASTGLKSMNFWAERIHPEDRRRIGRGLIYALNTKEYSNFVAECRVRRQDGQYIYVWSNGAILRDEADVPIRVVGSTLDITERKQMETAIVREREAAVIARDHAEEMNRLKSSFLANMSHEIRTPLTAIIGFAELLAEELDDPEKVDQAKMIRSSGNRLLDTINQVLNLARIEAGKIELHPESIRVLPVVEESAAMLRPLADKKKLQLRVVERSENIRASVDVLYFNQILTNLIGNAIKFTNSGHVTVSVWQCNHCEDDAPRMTDQAQFDPKENNSNEERFQEGTISYPCFAIEVLDEGIGISKEFLPRIFDEFDQESAGYDRNYEGTGLGLTITAKLVRIMNGSITVFSELGKGTRFVVRLPLG